MGAAAAEWKGMMRSVARCAVLGTEREAAASLRPVGVVPSDEKEFWLSPPGAGFPCDVPE